MYMLGCSSGDQLSGVDFLLPPQVPRGRDLEGVRLGGKRIYLFESSVLFADSRLLTLSGSSSRRSQRPYPFYSAHEWPSSESRSVPLLFKFTKCIGSGLLIVVSFVESSTIKSWTG